MKDEITAYFLKHFRIFEENYKVSRQHFDMAAIHKMRVSIKRTRILFELFEFADPKNFDAKKEFKKVKALFKLVGEIRDIQVQQNLLDKIENSVNQVFGGYSDYLEGLENRAIDQFEKKIGKWLDDDEIIDQEKINLILGNLTEDNGVRKMIQLINKKTARIGELKKDISNDEKIHKIRITLKQIHYLLELSKKSFPGDKFLDIPLERLDSILKIFGEWHDRLNALQYLQKYREKYDSPDQQLEMLASHIRKEKLIFGEQIRIAMNKELKFKYVLEL